VTESSTFRNLVDVADDGVVIADKTGRHLYANEGMATLTGYTREELCTIGALDLLTPEERDRILSRIETRVAGQPASNQCETVIVKKDGSRLIVSVTSGSTTWDGSPAGFAIFRDMTETRQTERALRQSQERFQNIIEKTPGCIYSYTVRDGKTREDLYVGPYLQNLLGESLAKSLGTNVGAFIALIHPEDRERMGTIGVMDPGATESVDIEYRVKIESGVYRWIRSIAWPYKVDETTVQWAGVFLDIDESKRTEQRLRQVERIETVGSVAGSLAHEVNNSLYPATVSIEKIQSLLAGEEPIDLARLRTLARMVDGSLTRASNMVQSITHFARLAAQDKIERFGLSTFVYSVLAECPDIGLQDIKTTVDIDPGISLTMNRAHAASLLGNLIGNAIDALEGQPAGTIRVCARQEGESVRIEVVDNGVGIEADTIEHIFEPFFSTKAGRGTGLGLAICRRIAELYSGELTVESTAGEGAVFTLVLPAS